MQLGDGAKFIMTSIAGRPYNVGFDFRVIAATFASNSINITSIKEYNYNSTFDLVDTTELLTSTYLEIGRGTYRHYTAGRNKDLFTIVYVTCSAGCMVCQLISFSIRKAVLLSFSVAL